MMLTFDPDGQLGFWESRAVHVRLRRHQVNGGRTVERMRVNHSAIGPCPGRVARWARGYPFS